MDLKNQSSTLYRQSRRMCLLCAGLILSALSVFAQSGIYRFKLTAPNALEYETVVRFLANATTAFDAELDALYLAGGQPENPKFSTLSSLNERLALNSLPLLNSRPTEVPVVLEIGTNGNYSLRLDVTGTDDLMPVVLQDRITGQWINLRAGAYNFTATTADRSDRFVLHFNRVVWTGSWVGVPTGQNVQFRAAYTAPADLQTRHVEIQSGIQVTLADGQQWAVTGDWQNNGSFTDANTGASGLSFQGTVAQMIGGTSPTAFRHLHIDNAQGVSLAAAVSVSGQLHLAGGTLTSNGQLSLLSSNSQTATVTGGTNTSLTGQVRIERHLALSGVGNYKFFSHPLRNTIPFSAVENLNPTPLNVILLDEPQVTNNQPGTGWISAGGAAALMQQGRGYAHWITADKILRYVGEPQLSDLTTAPLSYTPANDAQVRGFNLVGNPFPAVLDLDAVTRTDVGATFYVYDHQNDRYTTWTQGAGGTNGGARFVAPGQAMIVQALAAGSATLHFPATARVAQPATHFRTAMPLRLWLHTPEDQRYETAIRFDPQASTAFDPQSDALWMAGAKPQTPQWASLAGDRRLALNSLPDDQDVVLPLHFAVGQSGTYTLRAEGADRPGADRPGADRPSCYLADRLTGAFIALDEATVYRFEAKPGEPQDRFSLLINCRRPDTAGTDEQCYAYASGQQIGVFVPAGLNASSIEVWDPMGRQWLHPVTVQGGHQLLPAMPKGEYIVRVITAAQAQVRRVWIE